MVNVLAGFDGTFLDQKSGIRLLARQYPLFSLAPHIVKLLLCLFINCSFAMKGSLVDTIQQPSCLNSHFLAILFNTGSAILLVKVLKYEF